MIRLRQTVEAWGTPEFEAVLKAELKGLGIDQLPLQQGLSSASHALEDQVSFMVLGASGEKGQIVAKVGIFYTGVIAGCSCADDPTPVDEQTQYCEARVVIDRSTAEASIELAVG